MSDAKPDTGDNLMLVLCYLGPLGLVPYLTQDKDFIRWHARQGLTLTAVWLGWRVLEQLFLPLRISWIFSPVNGALYLALVALALVAIVKAVQGERWRIPLVADLSEKWGNTASD